MRSLSLASLLVLSALAASAQAPMPAGAEFQVNSFTLGRQSRPETAMAGNGDFVVVWQAYDTAPDRDDILLQRFDAAGNPLGGELQVNTFTNPFLRSPAVAATGDGNFVVVWQSYGQDGSLASIQGQRFDAGGGALGGEFQINSWTTGHQLRPAVAIGDGGDFVVAWVSGNSLIDGPDGDMSGIRGQRFDADGAPLGTEFPVNSYTTDQQFGAEVAIGAKGSFMVTWNSEGQDGDGYSVHGQRFDADGGALGGEFQINSWTTGRQSSSAVTADASGRFIVVWSSEGQDGDDSSVHGQRFDAAGQPVAAEFQVNSFTTESQGPATVAADDAGNFVVVWHSGFAGPDGDGRGAVGQGFDAAGDAAGAEFLVNTYTTSQQGFPRPAIGGDGLVVVWQSYGQDGSSYGIHGQRYLFSGVLFADGFESGDTARWSSTTSAADLEAARTLPADGG